jgi:hypothetical protein
MDDHVQGFKPCFIHVGNVSEKLNVKVFGGLTVHRSTHNTRIERLWLEGGRHFARGWRAFFTRLERLHLLERDDPHHLWLLHSLFIQDIQEDCDEFCKHWNSHPLSGKGKNMSPLVRSSQFSFINLLTLVFDKLRF